MIGSFLARNPTSHSLFLCSFCLLFRFFILVSPPLKQPAFYTEMGMFMSSMGGLPSTQMLGFVMGTLHKQFMDKEIVNFEQFQCAILDIFNTFNSALPGKHYDVPSRQDVEKCYNEWIKAENPEKKKELFLKFMKDNLSLSKLDDSTMLTGIVTPPAAMAAKRAGENLPQLKIIRVIPDVIFVPSATVIALITAKLTRRMFLGNLAAAAGGGSSGGAKALSHESSMKKPTSDSNTASTSSSPLPFSWFQPSK